MDLWDDQNLTFSKLVTNWLLRYDERIKLKSFTKNLISEFGNPDHDIDALELKHLLESNRIIPDAYLIDREYKTVFIFEVEDTHPLTPNKLRKLSEIWSRLDALNWEMRVFLIDRYMANWRVLPLMEVWHTLEYEDATKSDTKRKSNQIHKKVDWEATYLKLKDGSFGVPIVEN